MSEQESGFGLATLKPEGGKLWPTDYLEMYGRYPPQSFYTQEELDSFDTFQLSFIEND